MNSDGSQARQVSSPKPPMRYQDDYPAWSPDGKLIFSHGPSTNNLGDLFVVNRDGSGLKMFSASPLNENQADWGINSMP